MDAYLVPVCPKGRSDPGEHARYCLYCEPPDDQGDSGDAEQRRGLIAKLVRSFNRALAEGEAERRRQEAGQPPSTDGSRMGRWVKQKLASAVAEHRLLWALRKTDAATLWHPDSMSGERALSIALEHMRQDFSRHRLWAVIDGLIGLVTIPLALVPGPNVLGYFFAFRAVGHYFSLLGARRGMRTGLWTTRPAAELTALEAALDLPVGMREPHIDAAAQALGLERLPAFIRRVAPARA